MAREDERRAFLAAIAAAPWDDDAVRLVYSDWLLENDEPEEADRQRKHVAAERWLRELTGRLGSPDYYASDDPAPFTYEQVLEAAHQAVRTGEHFTQQGGTMAQEELWPAEARAEFWRCFEVATGVRVNAEQREHQVFSCSC